MTWTNSAPLGDVLRHPVSDIRGEFLLSLLSLVNVLLGFKPMDFDSFEKLFLEVGTAETELAKENIQHSRSCKSYGRLTR